MPQWLLQKMKKMFVPLACATLRAAVEGLPSPVLAQALTGGITKQEILELTPEPKSIAFHSLDAGSFVLAPYTELEDA